MVLELFPFCYQHFDYIIISIICCLIIDSITRRFNSRRHTVNDVTDVGESAHHRIDYIGHESALPKYLQHVPYVYSQPKNAILIARAREFYEISNSRRTIRCFKSDPIPKCVIQEIVRAAGTAPSGAHTEPWTFVAVSNKKMKTQIRSIVEQEEEINYKKRMGNKWTTDLAPLKTNWIKEYLTIAPYLILVFKQTHSTLSDGRKKNHYYHEMSVSIACGILIAAIQYAGLTALTSTPLNCGVALRNLLGRPSSEKLCLLIPVGYPADNATVPNLHRKPLSDILIEFD